jgi:hypothetical protein
MIHLSDDDRHDERKDDDGSEGRGLGNEKWLEFLNLAIRSESDVHPFCVDGEFNGLDLSPGRTSSFEKLSGLSGIDRKHAASGFEKRVIGRTAGTGLAHRSPPSQR